MSWLDALHIAGTVIVSLGGGAAIVIAAASWLAKVWAQRILAEDRERFRAETEKVLEGVRGEREKGVFVHRVQFETEFAAYRQIWRDLSAAVTAALRLRPMMDFVPKDKKNEEIKQERLETFDTDYQRFVESVRENKPFVTAELDEPLSETIRILHTEAIEYAHLTESKSGGKDYWESQQENAKKIQDQAETVCAKIRERVGLLVVIEDRG